MGSEIFRGSFLLLGLNCRSRVLFNWSLGWCWFGLLSNLWLCAFPIVELIIVFIISRNIVSINIEEVLLIILTSYEPAWWLAVFIIVTSFLVFPAKQSQRFITLLDHRKKILLQFKVGIPFFRLFRCRYTLEICQHRAPRTHSKPSWYWTFLVCSLRVRY